jgi:hypothetical protein
VQVRGCALRRGGRAASIHATERDRVSYFLGFCPSVFCMIGVSLVCRCALEPHSRECLQFRGLKVLFELYLTTPTSDFF